MERLRVDRSPIRLLLMGLVGLVLLVAAADIVWGHWLSTPPHNNAGVITELGRAQQRADFVWGAVFAIGGGALFGTAVVMLLRRRPVLVVYGDGLELFVRGPDHSDFVIWDRLRAVRSGRDDDPEASRSRDVLIIDVTEPGELPADPWGAEWVGDSLHIDAGGWQPDVTEVVVHAQLALTEHRRDLA